MTDGAVSPTLTTGSYDMVLGRQSQSPTMSSFTTSVHLGTVSDDDEDLIVWAVSQSSISSTSTADLEASSPILASDFDDDFVVLTRPGASAIGRRSSSSNAAQTTSITATSVVASAQVEYDTGLSTPLEGRGDQHAALLQTPDDVSGQLAARFEELSIVDREPSSLPPLAADSAAPQVAKKKAKKKKAKKLEGVGTTATEGKASGLPTPQVTPVRKKGKAVLDKASANMPGLDAQQAYPSPTSSPVHLAHPAAPLAKLKKKMKKAKFKAKAKTKAKTKAQNSSQSVTSNETAEPLPSPGLGMRPIVDDLSEKQSTVDEAEFVTDLSLYDEASTFISSYLSNPEAQANSVCRLTLIQSLIIELGLAGMVSALPASLKAAKTFLKSNAFLNVREYVAVRNQGPEAIRKLLYPSRKALIKDIRKKRNAASLKWVKEHGLQVLLVTCFH